jgi:hypothetical protein
MAYPHTMVGTLPSQSAVKMAIFRLRRIGFDLKKLSVMGKNSPISTTDDKLFPLPTRSNNLPNLSDSLFGTLSGSGMLFMRDVGLIVIAGPVAGVLAAWLQRIMVNQNAQVAIGGIVGAMAALGISRPEALSLEAGIKAGDFMVMVAGSNLEQQQVRQVLTEISAEILAEMPMSIAV